MDPAIDAPATPPATPPGTPPSSGAVSRFLANGAYLACGLGLIGLFFANRFLRTL